MKIIQFVALTVITVLLFSISAFPQFGVLGTPPDSGTGGQPGWSGWIANAACRPDITQIAYDPQGRLSECQDFEAVGPFFPGGVHITSSALYGVYDYPISDGSVSYSRGVGSYDIGIWAGLGCVFTDDLFAKVFWYYQLDTGGNYFDAGQAAQIECDGPSCLFVESQGLYSIQGFTPVPPAQYGDTSC